MHGNVWEWCQDGKRAYRNQAEEDSGKAEEPAAGASRVVRGGSFSCDPRRCRAASRFGFAPSIRFGLIGFRVLVSR